MRALTIDAHGGLGQLRVRDDMPLPALDGPTSVRVRIKAAAINRLDLWVLGGIPGVKIQPGWVLGSDGAGVIDAVGDAVDQAPQSFIGEPVLEKHLTRSKKKWLIGVAVALALLISLVVTGRNARSGYFLTFENSSATAAVCIDHGSSSRVLWFMPTRELCTDLMRSDLIPALQRQIDNHSRLSSFIDAQRYVAALKEVSALNDK